MPDREPELVLRTDLGVDECLTRQGATGLRGTARPDRWQPTSADLRILRKVDGHRFRMVNRLLERQRFRYGRFWYFHGELEGVPGGTVVSGRWELAAARRFELLVLAPAVALMAGAIFVLSLLAYLRGDGDATGVLAFGGVSCSSSRSSGGASPCTGAGPNPPRGTG